jgi:hypothetical protein
MKWVEIITVRSLAKVDAQLLDEFLRQAVKSKTAEHPVEIKIYQNSIVETDLSIHLYWETKPQHHLESPLGQQFSYALKGLGLLNHSVWVETTAAGFPPQGGNARSRPQLK